MKTVIYGFLLGLALSGASIVASENVQTISMDAIENSLACCQYTLDFIEYVKLRPYIKESLIRHLFITKIIPEEGGQVELQERMRQFSELTVAEFTTLMKLKGVKKELYRETGEKFNASIADAYSQGCCGVEDALNKAYISTLKDIQTMCMNIATKNSFVCYQYARAFIAYIKENQDFYSSLYHLFAEPIQWAKGGQIELQNRMVQLYELTVDKFTKWMKSVGVEEKYHEETGDRFNEGIVSAYLQNARGVGENLDNARNYCQLEIQNLISQK